VILVAKTDREIVFAKAHCCSYTRSSLFVRTVYSYLDGGFLFLSIINAIAMSQASRVVAVTGANRGLGFAICQGIASAFSANPIGSAQSLKLVLGVRDIAKGQAAAQQIQQALNAGGKGAVSLHVHQLDVSNDQSIKDFSTVIEDEYGACDVLVNNAGIYVKGWDRSLFDSVMRTNLMGPLHLTQRLLPTMLSTKSCTVPRVINMCAPLGSLQAQVPPVKQWLQTPRSLDDIKAVTFDMFANETVSPTGTPAYNFAKALLGLSTRLLNQQLSAGTHPVNVFGVNPGWCATDMGGAAAPRSADKGAESVVWLAGLPNAEAAPFAGKVIADGKIEPRWPNT